MNEIQSVVRHRAEGLDSGSVEAVAMLVDRGIASMMMSGERITMIVFDKMMMLSRGENDEFLGMVTYLNGKSLGYVQPPYDDNPDHVTRTAVTYAAKLFPPVMMSIRDAANAHVQCVADDYNSPYHDTATGNRLWMLMGRAFPALGGYMPDLYQQPNEAEILRRHLEKEARTHAEMLGSGEPTDADRT